MRPIPRLLGHASCPLVPTRAQYVRYFFQRPSMFTYSNSQHSNPSMADEGMQSTSPGRWTYEQTHQLSSARHCNNLRRNPLYSSLAHKRQCSWMGRLDYPRILYSTDTVHGYSSDQFVLSILSTFILSTVLTIVVVTFTGLGSDIWTVPFDDITMMFKVCSTQPKPSSLPSDN
jgi:hypothetical protein